MPLLWVRHAQATGQAPDAALTPAGRQQAEALARTLAGYGVTRIVSSPFARALQTAAPLARATGLPVTVDERLCEHNPRLCIGAAEALRAATQRIASLLAEFGPNETAVLVSHGDLTAVALAHRDPRYRTYDAHTRLSKPDAYVLHAAHAERIPLAP